MNKDKFVIGLFGEKGSGKETFTELLKEILPNKKIQGVRTSAILMKTLKTWGLPDIRENYSKLVISMEQTFGAGSLARANKQLIDREEADIVVIDGIRRQPEVDLVKSFPRHCLLYLTADPKLRFARLKSRQEKENEKNMTFEGFLAEESLPTEQFIPQMGQEADYRIENNGQIERFKDQIKDFCQKFELV
ncbi:hypothetical protein A2631_00960 [Candidatus Daviesbacteria bacterium RIFCSPHIGHO2_01_FULL_44_29]|uniref:Dephospho-CoA kinase n=1 Tax=Candidatus Daviesbacteria bacterium RIFCSPHIGHO2_02_FULL_43_12 TaxID=1797776 RepID=A0A1F5KHM8_9BACT|nr:MAG: hypothetical protein A2631_00960 [Candidatus Daviesbacteria bacterium RIFCSPHIGHO2_01_FULL_44_29]OGE38931.1 MAG: hypothetical protein A3E86_04725 [Candidatus Daviesbacteria bacterium RIFCSPHIGHO2_12_FULL_47_45]OGE40443.1 MAG: hypothetical protein A3D25_05460 [Candidatus Daviesbacteria bacterium RIFCSPHIGHO2_02_FULL_43_12]OGE69715.1 MAG: hypothetical protein A3B55_05975 [Candidatus Daviesbacteria bacterium RIFCSPLOWO2_01_FULL_43_15]